MRFPRLVRSLAFGLTAMTLTTSLAACARNRDYFDSVNNDHHRWDSREDAAYRRWEAERRMDHIEFERRRAEEQREYWTWRHSHPG